VSIRLPGRETPGREPSPAWHDETDDAPPAVPARPEQLSLFVFEDATPARRPRLRRLKALLTAGAPADREGNGPGDAAPARAPHASTPLWVDSFFD
jgi:hypothetical protein